MANELTQPEIEAIVREYANYNKRKYRISWKEALKEYENIIVTPENIESLALAWNKTRNG